MTKQENTNPSIEKPMGQKIASINVASSSKTSTNSHREDDPLDGEELMNEILSDDPGYSDPHEEHEEQEDDDDDDERTRRMEDENGEHDN